MTFAQRTIHIANVRKTRLFYHHKPYPLEIKTIGDLLIVRRKQAGLSLKRLAAKTGIRLHWLRRWEFDRTVPTQLEWDQLRQFVNLPATPILTFTRPESAVRTPQTIGSQLRKRRLELKLCLAEVAPKIGVSVPTLGLWELNKVFPKQCYHSGVVAFLGYNPFPVEAGSVETVVTEPNGVKPVTSGT